MTRVKICGITERGEAKMVASHHPDYIGVIIECENRRRSVTRGEASLIFSCVSDDIEKVGVFLDAPISLPLSLLEKGVIDIAQLHGKESDSYIADIGARGYRTIKAFTSKNLDKAYTSSATYVLIDSDTPGRGKVFDWNALVGFDRDYFLAGGLCCNNVRKAIALLSPFAVDVSSGTESNGHKDESLVFFIH